MNGSILKFYDSNQSPLEVSNFSVNLSQKDEQIEQCILNIKVSFALYQRIDKDSLFNLKPELKPPRLESSFLSDIPIELELYLNPDLLPNLREVATDTETFIAYLSSLNQPEIELENVSDTPDIPPLLNTDNWLCVSVKQIQDSQEIGYKTFWDYVDFSKFHDQDSAGEEIAEGIVKFMKDWTDIELAEITQKATEEIVNEIDTFFDNLNQSFFSELEEETEEDKDKDSIFEEVIDFFDAENRPYIKLQEQSALRLTFKGKNGQWTCYAYVKEQEREFVFYSLCPMIVPENKRLEVAKFITQVNYQVILGNFDLDFATGKIRYKTSINVGDEYLSYDLIKPLVYKNVSMMDKYLSKLVVLIDQG